jgi:hypothetical protein
MASGFSIWRTLLRLVCSGVQMSGRLKVLTGVTFGYPGGNGAKEYLKYNRKGKMNGNDVRTGMGNKERAKRRFQRSLDLHFQPSTIFGFAVRTSRCLCMFVLSPDPGHAIFCQAAMPFRPPENVIPVLNQMPGRQTKKRSISYRYAGNHEQFRIRPFGIIPDTFRRGRATKHSSFRIPVPIFTSQC